MNVLIIEDEKDLSKELKEFLSKQGFQCDVVHRGNDATEKIYVNEYDFILLDLGLPDYEGLDLLKEAKEAHKDASVIIITARSEVDDKVKGLDMGADDYLAKPFSLSELFSRMNAIIRRKHGLRSNKVNFHDFEMDLQNRQVKHMGKEITLTKKEFDLLHYLILNKNRVLTRLQLTDHIWGEIIEDDYDSNYIDVHIKNLRKKLSAYGNIDWLETVRGIGYRAKA
jgi:DNA-binding response OmpR family regulator